MCKIVFSVLLICYLILTENFSRFFQRRVYVKYRVRRYCLVVVLTSLCACAPVTMDTMIDDGKEPLSKTQLQELITDHILHLEAIDFDAKVHYLPDGRFTAASLQGGKDAGKWSISADDALCMKFKRWYFGDIKCYKLFSEKDTYVFFTINGARYYTGTKVSEKEAARISQSPSESSNIRAPEEEPSPAAPLSKEEKEHSLISLARNCPDCDLAGVELVEAQLVAANLAGANLSGADLRSANLRRANLAGAKLAGAQLAGTNLAGANLTDADLTNADLTGSNLIRADLTGAKLNGADFSGALLESIKGYKE